jgi:hypothetical protein
VHKLERALAKLAKSHDMSYLLLLIVSSVMHEQDGDVASLKIVLESTLDLKSTFLVLESVITMALVQSSNAHL